MADQPEFSILIPVYQEGEKASHLISKISGYLDCSHEFLVCYDFEEDNSLPSVKTLMKNSSLPIRLIKNEFGRGVLNAIKSGFNQAQGKYVVVTMADFSDPPEVLHQMVEYAKEQPVDVIAPSRYMKGGSQSGGPFIKSTLSRLAGLSLYYFAGFKTKDATNNFKLYSREFLESVSIESKAGFELALELTVKAHGLERNVVEIPTQWVERTSGESQFKLWQWLPHYLKWYIKGFIPFKN